MRLPAGKSLYLLLQVLLFGIYIINGLIYIPKQSHIPDEASHMAYATRLAKGESQKILNYTDASCMPVTVINVLPRAVSQLLNPGLEKNDWGRSDSFAGRYMTLLVCALTGIYILFWTRRLYGEAAATFALFLFVFCPNLNAHAGIVTNDAFAALVTLATTYYYYRYRVVRSWKYLLLFGISFGIAQVTKQALSIFFVIFPFALLVELAVGRTILAGMNMRLVKALAFAAVVLIVINTAFLFKDSFQALRGYKFLSTDFFSLQSNAGIMRWVPVPLPSPYLEGLDQVKHMVEVGAGDKRVSPPNYLLGENRVKEGFWYYYFVILLFKTPLSVLVLSGAFLFFRLRPNVNFRRRELFLLFVIASFFIFFNFLVSRQVGIRHILLIYPLLYVLLGSVVHRSTVRKLLPLIVAYQLFTFYYYFPLLLSYTNELIPQKKEVYRIMADSNVDYHHGEIYLNKYLKEHPDVKLPPATPAPGTYVVSLSDYVGQRNPGVEWLRKFSPVDHVYFSYLLVRVPDNVKLQGH